MSWRELLTGTNRRALRAHDLRATFVTLSLGEGRSENWISDRTGHTSRVMIHRYRTVLQRLNPTIQLVVSNAAEDRKLMRDMFDAFSAGWKQRMRPHATLLRLLLTNSSVLHDCEAGEYAAVA